MSMILIEKSKLQGNISFLLKQKQTWQFEGNHAYICLYTHEKGVEGYVTNIVSGYGGWE